MRDGFIRKKVQKVVSKTGVQINPDGQQMRGAKRRARRPWPWIACCGSPSARPPRRPPGQGAAPAAAFLAALFLAVLAPSEACASLEYPTIVSSVNWGAGGIPSAYPFGLAIEEIDGHPYAFVVNTQSPALTILNITDPASPRIASTGIGNYFASSGMAIAYIGGVPHALVSHGHGLATFDVSDPAGPVLVSDARNGTDGFTRLRYAADVSAAAIGNGTYAFVASSGYGGTNPVRGGVQIVDITDPANPAPASALSDVGRIIAVNTAVIGGHTYLVYMQGWESAIRLANVTDPANPVKLSRLGDNDWTKFSDARAVPVAEIGGKTYALPTGKFDSGFTMVNIANPSSPSAVSAPADGTGGFTSIHRTSGADIAFIEGRPYAFIMTRDDGFQVANLTKPAGPTPVSALQVGERGLTGIGHTEVKVAIIGGKTYAVVSSYFGGPASYGGTGSGAVEIIDVTPDHTGPTLDRATTISRSEVALHFSEDLLRIGPEDLAVADPNGTSVRVDSVRNGGNGTAVMFLDPAPAAIPVTIGARAGHGIVDTSENPLLAGNLPITASPDKTLPEFRKAVINRDTGILSMAFSEAIINATGKINLTGVSIHDGQGDRFRLTGANITGAGHVTGQDIVPLGQHEHNHTHDGPLAGSSVIHVRLAADLSRAALAMDLPLLDVEAGAVWDLAENPNAASSDAEIEIVDDTEPVLVSAALNDGTGVLSLTFSESIINATGKIDLGRMSVSDGGADSFQLTGAGIVGAGAVTPHGAVPRDSHEHDHNRHGPLEGSSTIRVLLTAEQFEGTLAMDMPLLDVEAGAVWDLAENPNTGSLGAEIGIVDGTEPVLASAALDDGTGVLSLTFPEPIINATGKIDLGKILVHDGQAAPFPLTGARIIEAGAAAEPGTAPPDMHPDDHGHLAGIPTIHILLDRTQRQDALALDPLLLDILAGAVWDLAENPNAASLDFGIGVTDGTGPELLSASLNDGTGALLLAFSEAIDGAAGSMDPGRISVHDGRASPLPLTGAAMEAAGPALNVTLTGAQLRDALALDSLLLDIGEGAVRDLAGNPNAESAGLEIVVTDGTGPELRSAAYTTGDGTLIVTFSEPLGSAVNLTRLHVRDSGESTGGVTLTGAIESVAGNTLTVALTATQQADVAALSAPELDIEQDAVSDLNDNGIAASPDGAITVIGSTPDADAGDGQTVDGGTQVTLDGSGSSDPNGDPLTYSWRQTSGSPTVSLEGADTATASFTAPQVASDTTLVFELTVSDGRYGDTDTVRITVRSPVGPPIKNTPPVADAGRDQTVRVGDTVTLRGSGSDRDGDSLTYSWTQASGPAAALSSGTATSPTFTAPPVASDTALVFRLTVSDGTDSSADTVRITVRNAVKEITSSGGSGGSRGGGGGGGGAPAEIITDVRVYSVSWDCAAGSVAVTAGPDTNQLSVGIRTSSAGERPVARAGGELPGTGSFTSAIAGADEFVVVEASLSYEGDQVITKIVNLEQCAGTAVLDRYEPPQQVAPEPEPRGLCSDGREPALRDGSRLLCLFPGTFETLSERGWSLARP